MEQNKAIVGGGIVIVAVAGLFYFLSGDGLPKPATTSTGKVEVENRTLTVPDSLIPTENKTTTPMPTTENAGAATPATVDVVMKTSMGSMTLRLDRANAPKTVENFLKLAQSKFYDGVRFHRVIKGFMIQGGDPLSKDDAQTDRWGTGGPGYQFADEINPSGPLYQKGYKRGVLAMANSGPNTNGSQFFIMHQDYPLPPLYAIFGEVISGQDVVDAIALVATAAGDRPLQPVTILSVGVK